MQSLPARPLDFLFDPIQQRSGLLLAQCIAWGQVTVLRARLCGKALATL